MGMFDYIRFKVPLPESPPDLEWQTKDTPEQYLGTYEVREDGKLYWEKRTQEWVTDLDSLLGRALKTTSTEWLPCCFTGGITFYSYEGKDTKKWWEYSAYFVNGEVKSIDLLQRPPSTT